MNRSERKIRVVSRPLARQATPHATPVADPAAEIVATTFGEASFDDQGNSSHGNASQRIFAEIAAALAPGSIPA